jgi:hypothetical protein
MRPDKFDINNEVTLANISLEEERYLGNASIRRFYHAHRLGSLVPLLIFTTTAAELPQKTIQYFCKVGNVLVLEAGDLGGLNEHDRLCLWVQILRSYGSCFAVYFAWNLQSLQFVKIAMKESRFIVSEIKCIVAVDCSMEESELEVKVIASSVKSVKSEVFNATILDQLRSTLKADCLDWQWQYQQTERLLLGTDAGVLVEKNFEKWTATEPFGQAVAGTRMIPMKLLHDGDSLHSPALILDRFRVGLIIDLSSDEGSYSKTRLDASTLFTDLNRIYYHRMPLVSKAVPSSRDISYFVYLVDCYEAFLRSLSGIVASTSPNILVHCHYGYNRTGLMICAYLIERCGLSVEQALEAFKLARPPGIKHQNYIDKLFLRYIDN